jgi:uncharacterized membrane protein
MNLNVYIICVAAAVLLAVPAAADSTATIHGEVYGWDTFEPLENAVVEVNSTPSQSMVAKYGVYSFELEPGDYLITANYYQNSTLIYSAEKTVKIKGEGSYVFDLLLLPIYSQELMESSEVSEISESEDTENSSTMIETVSNKSDAVNNSDADDSSADNVSITETHEINGPSSSTGYYFLAALALSLLLAGGYRFQKHRGIEKNKPETDKPEKSQPETNKLEKSRLLEEKIKPETVPDKLSEKLSVPVSAPDFSAKMPDERIESKTEHGLPVEPVETRPSGESDFGESGYEVREEEKHAEITEEYLIHDMPEIKPADLKQEAKGDKEISPEEKSPEEKSPEEKSPEEPAQVPEPKKILEPEIPAIKKNLPLPADLQEIMDIIRGQGGRITQKDLRSKLRYSEGKVSLMLADLERRELIEKFKRGRGNVVILRDEER